jgi:hypothetical protein
MGGLLTDNCFGSGPCGCERTLLPSHLMAEIASVGVIDGTYRWLCRREDIRF